MKPIVIYKSPETGLIHFTEDELDELIENVYNAGFADGSNSFYKPYSSPISTPNIVYTTEITC